MEILNQIQNISILFVALIFLFMSVTDPDKLTTPAKLTALIFMHVGIITSTIATLVIMWN